MLRFSFYPNKTLKTALTFLSFKGLTKTYLVKTSITHKKYLITRFIEENYPILAKSAAKILSLNLA